MCQVVQSVLDAQQELAHIVCHSIDITDQSIGRFTTLWKRRRLDTGVCESYLTGASAARKVTGIFLCGTIDESIGLMQAVRGRGDSV